MYYTACQDVRLQGSRVRQGAKHRCRQSWGERGDVEEAGRGEGPMGDRGSIDDLGPMGDLGPMTGDGAKA